MQVIDFIPVNLDIEELLKTIKIKKLKEQEIFSLLEECRRLIEPKAVYTSITVSTINSDTIQLQSGHTLKSIILADTLKPEQTIILYVVTIGPRLEERISENSKGSILQAWIMEKTGDYALGKAVSHVESRAKEKLGNDLSNFSPGSGTGKLFSIEQQATIFQVLNPAEKIGVRLTPNYLMTPRKSVSGIFATAPRKYVACQYCPREKCENRRRPYSGEYLNLKCEGKSSE